GAAWGRAPLRARTSSSLAPPPDGQLPFETNYGWRAGSANPIVSIAARWAPPDMHTCQAVSGRRHCALRLETEMATGAAGGEVCASALRVSAAWAGPL